MPRPTLLIPALVALLALGCVMIITSRLRKLAQQRGDAEQRAAAAFEEMSRLSQELRRRSADDPRIDASLRPGERLQRQYPGRRTPPATPRAV